MWWTNSARARRSITFDEILEEGTGADRQLRVFHETGDLKKVVDYMIEETEVGLFESSRKLAARRVGDERAVESSQPVSNTLTVRSRTHAGRAQRGERAACASSPTRKSR